MNTTLISHHLFVAALSNRTATRSQRPPVPQPTRVADGAGDSASNSLTIEHIAAMAERYWPDFPFGSGTDKLAD